MRKTIILLVLIISLSLPAIALAGDYKGTDDLVDIKMKEITGVSAKPPLIDISKGNLGLFLFAAGGFTAGTVCCYQWRKIFGEKAGK